MWNNDDNAGLPGSIAIDDVIITATGRSVEGELWDVSDLSEGVYLIEIISDQGMKGKRKVVIKR